MIIKLSFTNCGFFTLIGYQRWPPPEFQMGLMECSCKCLSFVLFNCL